MMPNDFTSYNLYVHHSDDFEPMNSEGDTPVSSPRFRFDFLGWNYVLLLTKSCWRGWVRLRGVLVRQLSHPKTRPHRSSISVDLVLICQIFFFNFFYMIILAIKKTYICPHNKWNPVKVISKIEFYELKKILHWDKFSLINNSINFN